MAGHSKWANIKHRKAKADAKKGKVFSRVAKEIITAVKLQGPDPKTNVRLKAAIQKAREINMPSDNIERNIKKASEPQSALYDEVIYELYGLAGVGILCEAMTDNKNRLATDMRIICNKTGARIATPGAVSFHFNRMGVIRMPVGSLSEEEAFALALNVGASEVEMTEEGAILSTAPDELHQVCLSLQASEKPFEEAEIEWIPQLWINCDEMQRQVNLQILERLEALEDVDCVYHNMTFL